MSINKSFLRRKLPFPLAWYFSYARAMSVIYNRWWLPCVSVCVGMPACLCHFESCCLFAWGIFSWHVSCAVKAYCVWVITCHCKPRALLTPQSCHCCCFSIALPLFVFLPNPASLLSFSLCLLFSESVYPARKVTPGSRGWWFLWSVYFICLFVFFKAFNHETTNAGLHEIPARQGWSFHL